jgi:hypothetical protein
MSNVLNRYLVGSIVLLSTATFAGPNVPLDYRRLASCNDEAIQFFQTITNGTLSNTGLLITVGKDKLLNLELVKNIQGSDRDGYSLQIPTESAEPVIIHPDGTGAWSHLACSQDASGVHCQNIIESLVCKFPPPVPSGFSGGH